MDKKLYVCPDAEILEIELQGFLAASIGSDDDNTLNNNGDDNGLGGEHFDPGAF